MPQAMEAYKDANRTPTGVPCSEDPQGTQEAASKGAARLPLAHIHIPTALGSPLGPAQEGAGGGLGAEPKPEPLGEAGVWEQRERAGFLPAAI